LVVVGFAGCAPSHGTIGALLAQRRDRTLVVREAPPELAAARAGIRPGDQILLIDGRDVRPMNPRELHATLSGEVGDPVKLTLVRSEQILRVTLRRTPARSKPGSPASVTTRAD
jgi:C-terminal processing protease CtpA/Prc